MVVYGEVQGTCKIGHIGRRVNPTALVASPLQEQESESESSTEEGPLRRNDVHRRYGMCAELSPCEG